MTPRPNDNMDWLSEEQRKELNDSFKKLFSPPPLNGGLCRISCNCVDIAEFENGGYFVKNVPCYGGIADDENK